MAEVGQYRGVLGFLFVYLLLAWPPFLYLNQAVLDAVVERLSLMDPLTIAWIVGAVVIVAGLLRAREGIRRYNQFLSAPSNGVAALVALSYLIAATAWWAVPELVFYLEVDVTLNEVLLLILVCQAPMLVFLSLMTVVGKALSA